MRRSPTTSAAALLPVALLAAACAGDRGAPAERAAGDATVDSATLAAPAPDTAGPIAVRGAGLAHPETALYDPQADVYLVSNVNGPGDAADGNGFIARIRPDGSVEALKWIDGAAPGVTLNGPKGMLFRGDTLLAADVGGVRRFDRRTGRPLGSIAIDSHDLNDLALGEDGTLYVSDLGAKPEEGAVWKVTGGTASPLARGAALDQPDGILAQGGGLLVAPFGGSTELYRLGPDGARTPVATLPRGKLDGLLPLPGGVVAVTSWDAKAVYRLDGAKATLLLDSLESPAQIGLDTRRNRLLIPLFNPGELRIVPLSPK